MHDSIKLGVFEWYLITNLPRLGFIFALSSLYLVHVSILFFTCIFIPIFYFLNPTQVYNYFIICENPFAHKVEP